MGEQNVNDSSKAEDLRAFVRYVLRDLKALDEMIKAGAIESDIIRIGAEQEFFLLDEANRPAPVCEQMMPLLKDVDVTPELAKFNIELNAPPFEFVDTCLTDLEDFLLKGTDRIRAAAEECGATALLTGILPTLTVTDLSMENMSDSPRYRAFNEALKHLRGGAFEFRIKGTDELALSHDSVMIESCNTSFQAHIQVAPDTFAESYNIAQLVAAPVLAAGTNSPVLFGQRLWRETRLALFQQSMDTRKASRHQRETSPRVSFGNDWVKKDVLEILREDIARFRVLMGMPIKENPFEAIAAGRAPQLDALRLHNGTVYRWNRPCYGAVGNKAHLRIENRILPAGPTVVDQVANMAFWLGLMIGGRKAFKDLPTRVGFDDARGNLTDAARHGLGAHFNWLDGAQPSAQKLILEELLPVARSGLAERNVATKDIDKFLGIIESRVSTGLTGSQWILSSLASMKNTGSKTECLSAVTAGMRNRQEENVPVHKWSLATIAEAGGWKQHYKRVEQYMSTELFTVNENEAVDLVACLMDWRHVRHVPVEDDDNRLVGIVSHRTLLRLVANSWSTDTGEPVPVKDIMHTDLVTIGPEVTTLEVIRLMREHKVACLPVVEDGRLIGLVTEFDLVIIAAPMLERALRD
ncbi:MAG: CBS domain-containing protein [Planctomycetota bacterium]|jgi:CBS domain-containing protein